MSQSKGFSLVELAISVTIIGVVLAGIIGGNKLLEQAEIRATISEMDLYKKDYYKFVQEYSAVPGDMKDASTFFAGCASGGIGNGNCDGNGDGYITFNMGNGFDGNDIGDELVKFHRHLNLSGINTQGGTAVIPNGYSSFGGAGQIGGYFPKGSYDNSTYVVSTVDGGGTGGSVMGVGVIASGGGDLISNFEQFTTLVFVMRLGSNGNIAGVIDPFKAFAIDRKIDDGDPQGANATGANTGSIRTINDNATGGCISGNNYLITADSKSCIVQMKIK